MTSRSNYIAPTDSEQDVFVSEELKINKVEWVLFSTKHSNIFWIGPNDETDPLNKKVCCEKELADFLLKCINTRNF
jgi:hypothetical protein